MTEPTVIASSVIRSVAQGASHGGVYLVDLVAQKAEQVVDWDEMDIDWSGRGKDRGLRGIAFFDGRTFIAASDEILEFDQSFRQVGSYGNAYLQHCHEIDVDGSVLWATSTGFDSVLALDLDKKVFTRGINFRYKGLGRWTKKLLPSHVAPDLRIFDPQKARGPSMGDTLHLNMVRARQGSLWVAGTGLRCLLRIDGDRISRHGDIPGYTHNAQPYGDGILMNHTSCDVVRYAGRDGRTLEEWPVPKYEEETLLHRSIPEDHARQGFARGLCISPQGEIFVGSSPATVTRYCRGSLEPLGSIQLTRDVRNAIHGLEIYPYPWPSEETSP